MRCFWFRTWLLGLICRLRIWLFGLLFLGGGVSLLCGFVYLCGWVDGWMDGCVREGWGGGEKIKDYRGNLRPISIPSTILLATALSIL